MDVDAGNARFLSRTEGQTYFTPCKHVSEFKGNIKIKSMKQLTVKIRSDIIDYVGILGEIHEKSRTRRRTGVGIALAGLGALLVVVSGGLAAPAIVGAGVALGGALIISVAAVIEHVNTKKNIKDVDMRWKQFVKKFLKKYVYYCDSENTARMILTHVKHVVYQEENSYEFFRLLLENINPLGIKQGCSDRLYGYLEDATHVNKDDRAPREFDTSSFSLFKIFDLIKLSLTLDQNSESAASQPLRNLADFLDIVIVVVDNLPKYCDCSRYKVVRHLPTEDMIQMCETAIRLAQMCKSEAWASEIYRRKKGEAELQKMYEDEILKLYDDFINMQKMYEDQVGNQRLTDAKVEIQKMDEAEIRKICGDWLQQVYEEEILNRYDDMIAVHEAYVDEILKMYKIRIAENITISTMRLVTEEHEYDKHRCPVCKAFNCQRIEVCAICHRPLIKVNHHNIV